MISNGLDNCRPLAPIGIGEAVGLTTVECVPFSPETGRHCGRKMSIASF